MVQRLTYNSVPSKKKNYKIFSQTKKTSFFIKKFSSKIDLDILFWKMCKNSNKTIHNLYTHDLEIKNQFYKFLKILKTVKKSAVPQVDNENFNTFKEFGFKLQSSGIGYSHCEREKKISLKKLKLKLSKFETFQTLRAFPLFLQLILKKKEQDNFSQLKMNNFLDGFQKFEILNSFASKNIAVESIEKKEKFLQFLKSKYFYTRICEARVLSLVSTFRKRYNYSSFYVIKLQKNIQTLFTIYPATRKKFLLKRKEKHRTFKKLLWKRKKRKKWKKRIFLRFLGFRKRFSSKFYVPKHLEINFKTLNLIYLGFTDSKTTNPRLPFWLNLRKLVTFLSK